MTRPNIAVVGAGYMGTNHARVIRASERAQLAVIIDADTELAGRQADQFGAKASGNLTAAFACDAAIVATSTDAHVDVASRLLEAGVPVLVEKPIAIELDDVELLCNLAAKQQALLMCGFIERFNPVVAATQTLIDEPPIHIVAVRHSPAAPRAVIGVVHDLLIHDLDLSLRFAGGAPLFHVVATAWAPPGAEVAEIADCTMKFANGTLATMSASRAGQRKVRSVQIYTQSTLLDLDLLRHDVTIYRHIRHEQDDNSLTYRAETVIDIPFVRHHGEPLALQFDHFLDMMDGRGNPSKELDDTVMSHRVADEIARQCLPRLHNPSPAAR